MLLRNGDLAQRAVWILEALYGNTRSPQDPIAAERVLNRMGSGPPDMWGKFKVSGDLSSLLSEHGRRVCHAAVPGCNGCELRKFCGRYRDDQRSQWEADEASPTVVDLFCGAGGASLGFTMAGFRVLLAVDVDEKALLTYRLNHPELPQACIIQKDLFDLETPAEADRFRTQLLQILNGRRVDVVVGGPPCQGFSQIGTDGRSSARSLWDGAGIPEDSRQESAFKYDPKNRLYRQFLTIVEWLQPRFCVMENVPAMIHIGDGRVRRQVVQDFEALGYRLPTPDSYNSEDYGVPQRRERALFLAGRDSLASISVETTSRVKLGEAIRDLPPLQAGTGDEVARRTGAVPVSDYALVLSQETALIHNHVARPHMESDLKLYSLLKPGDSIKDRPELMEDRELFHYQNADRFRDIYKRQDYEAPSSTVIAHLSKDGNMYIHPEQVRTYTVREAARVQSFPDDYIFCGSRTAQFRQVGNAVPPLFIRPFADLIATILGYREGKGAHQAQSRLPI